ncbi:unnamed protein product, partial [Dibothriocephalus latus]
ASAASKPGRRPRKRPRKPPVRRVVAEAYPAEIVPPVDPADGSVLPVLASPSFSAVVNHNGDAPERTSPPEPIFLGSASAVITSTNQEASIPTAVSPADQRVKKRRAPSETSEQSVSENEDDQDEAEEEEDSEEDEEEEDDGEDEDDEIRGHESPVKETPSETDAAVPARQCYVICQDNCSTRKVRKNSKCHLRITHQFEMSISPCLASLIMPALPSLMSLQLTRALRIVFYTKRSPDH